MTNDFERFRPAWPGLNVEVERAVRQALVDGSWGKYEGPCCEQLRSLLRNLHQMEHVRLCCSGTMAVELALRGIGLEVGDEVILAAYDFPGNFRAVENVGARPVLVDIDAQSGCLGPAALQAALRERTKAVLVSHLHGGVARMDEITRIAMAHGAAVVEDACQAPLAMVQGRFAATWGSVSTLSFGGSKLTTAGRGGAVLTNDPHIAQRIRVFSDRGNDAFPLSELQAAALVPQWGQLAEQNAKRQSNAKALYLKLANDATVRWRGQVLDETNRPSYYKVGFSLSDSTDRERWLRLAQQSGVPVDKGFRGFVRRSHRRCDVVGCLNNAREACEKGVVLHHPVLLCEPDVVDRLADAIKAVASSV